MKERYSVLFLIINYFETTQPFTYSSLKPDHNRFPSDWVIEPSPKSVNEHQPIYQT